MLWHVQTQPEEKRNKMIKEVNVNIVYYALLLEEIKEEKATVMEKS